MVSELASWSSESSLELLPESSPELLPESLSEVMRSTTTLLPRSSLEESELTSMHVDHFFLHVEGKNPASPWWASLESANLALACMCGFLPQANEEPTSSMERRGRHTGAARWDGSSSSPWNLTLLGAADSTEEDGWGHGRRASSLQNLPLELRAIPATETRL
jgi:hypothetical protein